MNKKFQFLLLGDGISHQKMGTDQVTALRRLGYNVACYFPKKGFNELIENPDYVLVLKPRIQRDLVKHYKDKGSKLAFLVSDERFPKEHMKLYDFFLSISLDWQEEFQKEYPDKPCYLMKEEYDYCMRKVHKENSFKIVTIGYAQCLKRYLKPILDQIKIEYKNNIYIVSNWGDDKEADKMFSEFHQDNYEVPINKMCRGNFDKWRIEQYNQYDVGIVGVLDKKRPSNRVKSLLYAGLPVVAVSTKNHNNLWFNNANPTILKIKNNTWTEQLKRLENIGIRQSITDYNYVLTQINGGLDKAGEAIIEAINKFEQL